MAFKKILISSLALVCLSTGCKPSRLALYTQRPSGLSYLLEPASPLTKNGKMIYVQVDKGSAKPIGRVERVDTKVVYAVVYSEVKIAEGYYLDSSGVRGSTLAWTKAALEREIERNSSFQVAASAAEADYILNVKIENLKAYSEFLNGGSDVHVPLGRAGVATLPTNRVCEITQAYGDLMLSYSLTDRSGTRFISNTTHHRNSLQSAATVGVPLAPLWLKTSCNAQAVEMLSESFRQNFQAIIIDLGKFSDDLLTRKN